MYLIGAFLMVIPMFVNPRTTMSDTLWLSQLAGGILLGLSGLITLTTLPFLLGKDS
jgi:hypothetical protein